MTASKTIVITGASDGIGAAGAQQLQHRGHTVVIVGRSPEKTRAVARELGADHFVADFSRLDDVRSLADALRIRHPHIDVLANNAGGVFGAKSITSDGFELTLQVNHLAPFLLTHLLHSTLVESRATVIQTASVAARLFGRIDVSDLNNDRRYSPNKAYGDAKLANILFTRELHNRFHGEGISAAAFHPGFISSGFAGSTSSNAMKFIYRNPLVTRFLGTPATGADQLVWLADSAPTEWTSGRYYEKRAVATRVNPQSLSDDLAHQLWSTSAAMTGVLV